MKLKFSANLLIIFVFCCFVSAQEKTAEKWTRIEVENKEVSASFPSDFIVDAEKREWQQVSNIIGFQNGARVEMTVFKDNSAENRLNGITFPTAKVSTFTSNGLKGKRATSTDSNNFFESIYIASPKFLYLFSVTANSNQTEEVKRFLYSIQIKGKPIYTQTNKDAYPEETASLSSFQTSSEVTEAFNRKYEKQKSEVIRKSLSEFSINEMKDKNIRPAIELFRPYINYSPSINFKPRVKTFEARLRVNVLANGQLGDIIVYSDEERDFLNNCVETARRTKFIPAKQDGKYIDSVTTMYFMFQIFSPYERR